MPLRRGLGFRLGAQGLEWRAGGREGRTPHLISIGEDMNTQSKRALYDTPIAKKNRSLSRRYEALRQATARAAKLAETRNIPVYAASNDMTRTWWGKDHLRRSMDRAGAYGPGNFLSIVGSAVIAPTPTPNSRVTSPLRSETGQGPEATNNPKQQAQQNPPTRRPRHASSCRFAFLHALHTSYWTNC